MKKTATYAELTCRNRFVRKHLTKLESAMIGLPPTFRKVSSLRTDRSPLDGKLALARLREVFAENPVPVEETRLSPALRGQQHEESVALKHMCSWQADIQVHAAPCRTAHRSCRKHLLRRPRRPVRPADLLLHSVECRFGRLRPARFPRLPAARQHLGPVRSGCRHDGILGGYRSANGMVDQDGADLPAKHIELDARASGYQQGGCRRHADAQTFALYNPNTYT